MQVQQIMTANVTFCRLGTNLAAATELLWTMDVGALPVVDDDGNVLGILTDRDICIALGTRNVPASDVLVDDVMAKEVWTCRPQAGGPAPQTQAALSGAEMVSIHFLGGPSGLGVQFAFSEV